MRPRTYIINRMLVFVLAFTPVSCFDSHKADISNVKISFPGENVLNATLAVNTGEAMMTRIKYWMVGDEKQSVVSPISEGKTSHKFVLANLESGKQYGFNIVTSDNQTDKLSDTYFFKTINYAKGSEDSFRVVCKNPSILPENFRQGYIMVHRREAPGIIFLLDAEGNIVWHHQLKDAGFKVVHFTKNKTFLGLVGTKGFETLSDHFIRPGKHIRRNS